MLHEFYIGNTDATFHQILIFQKFLPTFPLNNDNEQDSTIQLLFGGENIRFGNPLKDFHRNLKNGYYRPDIARMRRMLRKALTREYKLVFLCLVQHFQ